MYIKSRTTTQEKAVEAVKLAPVEKNIPEVPVQKKSSPIKSEISQPLMSHALVNQFYQLIEANQKNDDNYNPKTDDRAIYEANANELISQWEKLQAPLGRDVDIDEIIAQQCHIWRLEEIQLFEKQYNNLSSNYIDTVNMVMNDIKEVALILENESSNSELAVNEKTVRSTQRWLKLEEKLEKLQFNPGPPITAELALDWENLKPISNAESEQFFQLLKEEESNDNLPDMKADFVAAYDSLSSQIGRTVYRQEIWDNMYSIWKHKAQTYFDDMYSQSNYLLLEEEDTKNTIISDFIQTHYALANENIYQDGEASATHYKPYLFSLNEHLSHLETLVGRPVSYEEVSSWEKEFEADPNKQNLLNGLRNNLLSMDQIIELLPSSQSKDIISVTTTPIEDTPVIDSHTNTIEEALEIFPVGVVAPKIVLEEIETKEVLEEKVTNDSNVTATPEKVKKVAKPRAKKEVVVVEPEIVDLTPKKIMRFSLKR